MAFWLILEISREKGEEVVRLEVCLLFVGQFVYPKNGCSSSFDKKSGPCRRCKARMKGPGVSACAPQRVRTQVLDVSDDGRAHEKRPAHSGAPT